MKRGRLTMPEDDDWETGDAIDWRYRWNIINRRKWSIIGLALAVGLLTTLVVFAMTPIYRASATLLIESQAPNVVSIQEVYGLDTRSQDYLATQIEIMGGRPIAESVVDGLGLIEQPEFRPEHRRPLIGLDWRSWLPFGMQKRLSPSQQNERERAVDAYLDKLRIEPVRMTQLVRVQFDSVDPKLAARVAEAHAKAYIESTLEARADATRSATEWMATRVESLRKELQASEASLQTYREQEQIIDATGLKALPAAEICLPGCWKCGKRSRRRRLPTCRSRRRPEEWKTCWAFRPCSRTKACAVPRPPRRLHNRRWPSWRNATGRHILK